MIRGSPSQHSAPVSIRPRSPAPDRREHGSAVPQKKRQVFSCTKCRARKVKVELTSGPTLTHQCDRVQPCTACCARGRPTECNFIVTEGEEYFPIAQSHEIRRLRAENQRLKERLRRRASPQSSALYDADAASDVTISSPSATGERGNVQHSRRESIPSTNSIYFGAPSFMDVVDQLRKATAHSPHASISHAAPRSLSLYNGHREPYPFSTFWLSTAGTAPLVECLPPRAEMLQNLQAFERRVPFCVFPHLPEELSAGQVSRYLQNIHANAEQHPDVLALIFASLAVGSQHAVYDADAGEWVDGKMESDQWKRDLWVAAAMQALRLASYCNRPTLSALNTVIIICPYLTNSGRFLDAWMLFGLCIRLAYSLELHRDPGQLRPRLTQVSCQSRQQTWWWLLHTDQLYASTLGRPLGISGIGDCPFPSFFDAETATTRVHTYIHQFTILARQILATDSLNQQAVDRFTDQLLALRESCPDIIRLEPAWIDPASTVPEWPLCAIAATSHGKLHTYLILLNQQRGEYVSPDPTEHAAYTPSRDAGIIRGHPRVLDSSRCVLDAWEFFDRRLRAGLLCWTLAQQALNAAVILALHIIATSAAPGARDFPSPHGHSSTPPLTDDIARVRAAHASFAALARLKVHKLAGPAAAKLASLLASIDDLPAAAAWPAMTLIDEGDPLPRWPSARPSTSGAPARLTSSTAYPLPRTPEFRGGTAAGRRPGPAPAEAVDMGDPAAPQLSPYSVPTPGFALSYTGMPLAGERGPSRGGGTSDIGGAEDTEFSYQ